MAFLSVLNQMKFPVMNGFSGLRKMNVNLRRLLALS
jgi:hypothetical protein